MEIQFIEILRPFAYLRHWFTIYWLANYYFEDENLLPAVQLFAPPVQKKLEVMQELLDKEEAFGGVYRLNRAVIPNPGPTGSLPVRVMYRVKYCIASAAKMVYCSCEMKPRRPVRAGSHGSSSFHGWVQRSLLYHLLTTLVANPVAYLRTAKPWQGPSKPPGCPCLDLPYWPAEPCAVRILWFVERQARRLIGRYEPINYRQGSKLMFPGIRATNNRYEYLGLGDFSCISIVRQLRIEAKKLAGHETPALDPLVRCAGWRVWYACVLAISNMVSHM